MVVQRNVTRISLEDEGHSSQRDQTALTPVHVDFSADLCRMTMNIHFSVLPPGNPLSLCNFAEGSMVSSKSRALGSIPLVDYYVEFEIIPAPNIAKAS